MNHPADLLNKGCRCTTLDEAALEKECAGIIRDRPNLFSRTMTYISSADFLRMEEFILIAEKILAAKEGPRGVFMGYDFHLTAEGPKLIEINTNAGGAYLNLILARSQTECCPVEELYFHPENLEEKFLAMFRNEWKLAGHTDELKSIAIVDEKPEDQFLYPEFVLFRDLFRRNGIYSVIADPSELEEREDGIYHDGKKIDLIYNRLTDFSWEKKHVVLTPSPLHHASHAHKARLAQLSDPEFLSQKNLSQNEISTVLRIVPKTRLVGECSKDELWSERKKLFFKPVSGFGSRAAYRGDKMTTRVWEEIQKGHYVAQDLVPPGQRVVAGKENALKADIRAYTYDGEILLLAARLYEGQTTNFRTSGGGFSPVFVIKEKDK